MADGGDRADGEHGPASPTVGITQRGAVTEGERPDQR
jgi:hypothetical protein